MSLKRISIAIFFTSKMFKSCMICLGSFGFVMFSVFMKYKTFELLFFLLAVGCTTGFNKSDCSVPCPNVNCEQCQLKTGICQSCKAGYQGNHCELGKLPTWFDNRLNRG